MNQVINSKTQAKAPSSGHISWIDYAKSFAIFSVVVLHTHSNEAVSVAINAYVMPLFFFLSGFLFSRERNPEFGPFFRKRFRQLVVPYIWINLVVYALWLVVLRHYGSDAGSDIGWHQPLLAIALGIPRNLSHDIPLWSILCFFVVEMIYYICPCKGKLTDLVIAAIGYAAASVISLLAGREGIDLPLTLAPAAGAISFYALGHFVAAKADKFGLLLRPSAAILIIGILLLMAGFYLNAPTDFFLGILGNPAYFLIGAIGGVTGGVQIALWMAKFLSDGHLVRMISRGTLLICGFHLPAFAFMKGVMLMGFGVQPEVLTDGILRGLLFSVAAVALCLPLIWIIERYFRFLVSK